MNNAVFNPMPAPAVMMKLCAAKQITHPGKVAPFRDWQVPARRLSFLAVLPFLLLGACAEAPAPEPRASLPVQRNLASPAPTPCTIPNTGQTDTPNVLNSPDPSSRDRLRAECIWGVPPPRTTWSGPTLEPSHGNALGRPEANRYSEAERFRQEQEDFQRRQRTGR
jgi:hypothetical protein